MAKNVVLSMPLITARDVVMLVGFEVDALQAYFTKYPVYLNCLPTYVARMRRLDELKRVLEEQIAAEDRKNKEDDHGTVRAT
jgi:hypothetical protein